MLLLVPTGTKGESRENEGEEGDQFHVIGLDLGFRVGFKKQKGPVLRSFSPHRQTPDRREFCPRRSTIDYP